MDFNSYLCLLYLTFQSFSGMLFSSNIFIHICTYKYIFKWFLDCVMQESHRKDKSLIGIVDHFSGYRFGQKLGLQTINPLNIFGNIINRYIRNTASQHLAMYDFYQTALPGFETKLGSYAAFGLITKTQSLFPSTNFQKLYNEHYNIPPPYFVPHTYNFEHPSNYYPPWFPPAPVYNTQPYLHQHENQKPLLPQTPAALNQQQVVNIHEPLARKPPRENYQVRKLISYTVCTHIDISFLEFCTEFSQKCTMDTHIVLVSATTKWRRFSCLDRMNALYVIADQFKLYIMFLPQDKSDRLEGIL